jgi:hypothetical protein
MKIDIKPLIIQLADVAVNKGTIAIKQSIKQLSIDVGLNFR